MTMTRQEAVQYFKEEARHHWGGYPLADSQDYCSIRFEGTLLVAPNKVELEDKFWRLYENTQDEFGH